MPDFTEQQARAITARDFSVALAAGAGCGKTFVLTERFLECLDPERPGGPLRLDQLTAITFTERAAREMRQRIRKTCLERLQAAPEKHVDYWLRTLRDLDAARISTIHSFCGALLRSHAVEARLDPHFQVLDATATQTLLFELIDEQLRDRLAERDEAVIELVVQFDLKGLRDLAGRLLDQRQEIDWNQWREETPQTLVARWAEFWRSDALPRLLDKVGKSPAAAAILRLLDRELPSHAAMRARCELLREKLPQLAEAADPSAALRELREAARVQGGGGKNAWANEESYETFRQAAEELRKTIDKVVTQTTFDQDRALTAAKASLALLNVTRGLCDAYRRRKQELAALDFDDLLIGARELLVGPARKELRQRLAAQTKLLLVDEFQDTDPLQVELVRALCDGQVSDGRLFFVGDYKQSIYRFRGADPHVFRQLREEIPAAGRLPLTRNFRSQPGVIDFVNSLFAAEIGRQYEPLEAHRPQLGPRPSVECLWAIEPEVDDSYNPEPGHPRSGSATANPVVDGAGADGSEGSRSERNRRREAEWIARRLRNMLENGEELVLEKDAAGQPTLRAVRPGDITLLFRALTNVEYYEEALRRHGIDYYLVGGHAFYAQQEIFDVVNLLRAVASPCDAVSLAGILRSPMFGLLDETLFQISRHDGGLSGGFQCVLEYVRLSCLTDRTSQPGKPDVLSAIAIDEQTRLRFAAETIAELRAEKDRVPIAELIHKALELTGYDAMLLGEFLGERKLANLHKLIEQARQFDAAGIFTLADFIVQLAQFVARQPDEPLAATQPESINAVRLMSIHQSKGLEFPVVVVVDLDRPRRVAGEGVAFTRELGPMVRVPDCTSGYDLFMQLEQDEDMAELTRLFYVAATRAGDYLILSSGLDDLDKPRGPWLQLLQRHFDLGSGQLHSHGGARVNQLVKVIREEPPLSAKSVVRPKSHDLRKILVNARKLAAGGQCPTPDYLRAIEVDRAAKRHYSVSRLHGTLQPRVVRTANGEDEETVFATALDALGLGTLVHAVLADLIGGSDDSPAAINRLVRKHGGIHMSEATDGLEDASRLIAGLTATPRWASLREATCRHTELEFLLAWPPDAAGPECPFIQGFIDCLYQDRSGDWRLLDYKTNRIAAENLAGTIESYEMQMLVYALAVDRIFQRPPVEIVLHFLRGNIEHRFTWDAVARQRAVDLVNTALERDRSPV